MHRNHVIINNMYSWYSRRPPIITTTQSNSMQILVSHRYGDLVTEGYPIFLAALGHHVWWEFGFAGWAWAPPQAIQKQPVRL